jgi:hypothetical protein
VAFGYHYSQGLRTRLPQLSFELSGGQTASRMLHEALSIRLYCSFSLSLVLVHELNTLPSACLSPAYQGPSLILPLKM